MLSAAYLILGVRDLKIVLLSDSNKIRTHNHLVHKRTLNPVAKLASLAKWFSVRLWTKWL